MNTLSRLTVVTALTVAIAAGGCAELDRLGGGRGDGYDGWDDRGGDRIVGEIRDNNRKGRELEIRTDQRLEQVRYDADTRVVYQQRTYRAEDLQPGDYVTVRGRRDSSKNLFHADAIRVQETKQDRATGPRGKLERLDGTVEYVDTRRGLFELNDGGRRRVTVVMPSRPGRNDEERFRRLRDGDRVRIEGRFLDRNRFELENFL